MPTIGHAARVARGDRHRRGGRGDRDLRAVRCRAARARLDAFAVGEAGTARGARAAGRASSPTTRPQAVVVGLSPSFDYDTCDRAASLVRSGARFLATNTDATLPTPTGLRPGAGAIVASIATASGREPEVAGKPSAAMARFVASRVQPGAVVGDRPSTDGALAAALGVPFALVASAVDEPAPPDAVRASTLHAAVIALSRATRDSRSAVPRRRAGVTPARRRPLDRVLVERGHAADLGAARDTRRERPCARGRGACLVVVPRRRGRASRSARGRAPLRRSWRLEARRRPRPIRGGVAGRLALDVGASTGGFTDCLLQQGRRGCSPWTSAMASCASASPPTRGSSRWSAPTCGTSGARRRRHRARGRPPMLIVDVSFTSVVPHVPGIVALGERAASLLVLVKPQFEVDHVTASRGRGVITDPAAWRAVARAVCVSDRRGRSGHHWRHGVPDPRHARATPSSSWQRRSVGPTTRRAWRRSSTVRSAEAPRR